MRICSRMTARIQQNSAMTVIAANIRTLRSEIPSHVKIVAISKNRSTEEIMEAYMTGQRIFGENRVQELVAKYHTLPGDIEWHMVGHLQTNKVKYIAPFISLIHSVDSLRLLQAIHTEGSRINRVIPCLLQVYIASEETKFGFDRDELLQVLASPVFHTLSNVAVTGVMGMASFTTDMKTVAKEFRYLASVFRELKNTYFPQPEFREISMGMSGDYKTAISEGATMVRIGNLIFGSGCQV